MIERFRREHTQSAIVTVLTLVVIAGLVVRLVAQIPNGWGQPIPFLFLVIFVISIVVHGSRSPTVKHEQKMIVDSEIVTRPVFRGFHNLAAKYGETLSLNVYQDNEKLNAYTGGFGAGAQVVMSSRMARTFTNAQQLGVLAHEIGHQVNADLLLLVLTTTLVWAVSAVQTALLLLYFWHLTFGAIEIVVDGHAALATQFYWNTYLKVLFAQILLKTLASIISREREQMADAFAVANGHGQGLYEALTILGKQSNHWPIIDALQFFIGSHPPVSLRLRDIKMMLEADEGIIPDKIEHLLVITIGVIIWLYGYFQLNPVGWAYVFIPLFILGVLWLTSRPYAVHAALSESQPAELNGLSPRAQTTIGLVIMVIMLLFGVTVLLMISKEAGITPWMKFVLAGSWGGYMTLFAMQSKKAAKLAIKLFAVLYVGLGAYALFMMF